MIFLIFKALFYVRFYIYIILRRLNFLYWHEFKIFLDCIIDAGRQKDEDDERRNEGDWSRVKTPIIGGENKLCDNGSENSKILLLINCLSPGDLHNIYRKIKTLELI